MQKPETIIFREYRTIVDDLWDLNQDISKTEDEEAKQSLRAEYTELDKKCDEQAKEIKQFIIPFLDKNASEVEIKERFTEWCTTWDKYINNMEDDDFEVFVTAENKFYDTDGENKEIAKFRPSKIFTNNTPESSMAM